MKKILSVIVVFLLFSLQSSFAWSSPGHMVVAAIAYRDLPAATRTNLNELLTHHPDYAQWKEKYSPDKTGVDLETYIFLRASTWPDEIRRHGNPYDHPQWHYVDYPLIPLSFPYKPSPAPTNDALYGISQSEKVLKDKTATPELKAVYLSWLIHLVGDIHQPLHCATLTDADYPKGDKGGNAFYVRPNTAGVNLHSIWDKGLGSSVNPRTQYNYAIELGTKQPRKSLPELKQHKTVESWTKESRKLAIEDGYLNGKLQGSKEASDAPPLPEGYTKTLKAVAEKQAALAGYRLADEINQYVRYP